MATLHSMLQNLAAAGVVYGWRLDAMAMTAVLSLMVAAYGELRRARSVA